MPRLISENRIVRLLRDRYGLPGPRIREGIGDDAAVLRPGRTGEYLLVTTDMLLEGIDFRREWTDPRSLGRKSIAVNLSDLAAMGARPRFFTVSLAVPSDLTERWLLRFYDGLTDPAWCAGARLIGGDLSHSDGTISISVAAMGESVGRKVVYRHGGRPGDFVYATGALGQSAAGLRLLEAGCVRPGSGPRREAVRAHRSPKARTGEGMWLARSGLVRCMMDLSDGLSVDLPRMCAASGVGAEIEAARVPVFAASREWGCDPLELALDGGEDFELLFAVSPAGSRTLEKKVPSSFPRITRIGTLTREAGRVFLLDPAKGRRPLAERGYDHFRGRARK